MASENVSTNGESIREHVAQTASVLRERLSSAIKRIDRRWSDMFDLGVQFRKHPIPFIAASSGLALTIAGGLTLAMFEARRRRTFGYRIKRMLSDIIDTL